MASDTSKESLEKQFQCELDEAPYVAKLRSILELRLLQSWPAGPTRVLDHLYLGSERDARDRKQLRELGITHVCNTAGGYCRTGPGFYGDKVRYMEFDAEDSDDYDILQHVDPVFEFVEHARRAGGRALVHCLMGINRSGALVTSYCMLHRRWGPLTAARHVKRARHVLLTNCSFQSQLVTLGRTRGLLQLDKAELEKYAGFLSYSLIPIPEDSEMRRCRSRLKAVCSIQYGPVPRPREPARLLPHLYLGSLDNARDVTLLDRLRITHVVNCATQYDVRNHGNRRYLGLATVDANYYDMLQHLPAVWEFVEAARAAGGRVLLHCRLGVNRSGLLGVLCVMLARRLGPVTAAREVKRLRQALLTNEGFQAQLATFARDNGYLQLDDS